MGGARKEVRPGREMGRGPATKVLEAVVKVLLVLSAVGSHGKTFKQWMS